MINFVIDLLILINKKNNSYDSILIILNLLTKLIYYKLIKIIINISNLTKIIINIVIKYYIFLNLIVINRGLLFTSKFQLSLYYFFGIKQKLFITFDLKIDN